MDDIGVPPFDSKHVEVWIQRELKKGHQPEYIADELLKRWDKGHFYPDAKTSAGKFLFMSAFYSSLLRVLKDDLKAGYPLPWATLLQVLIFERNALDKTLIDACLIGATRDKQLHAASAQALRQKEPDARWKKILEAEQKDRFSEAKRKRNDLIDEMKIFRNERMETEIRESLSRVLALFPEDPEANTILKSLSELELERTLQNLRKAHEDRGGFDFEEEKPEWPDLEKAVTQISGKLDLEQAYNFSIALHEMGFYDKALEVLRARKKEWNTRERLWELELLIAQRSYAEALALAQLLIGQNPGEPVIVQEALYFSAKAYRGLEDTEQAASILRGIIEHDPAYRDAAVLLVEWGGGR